MNNPELFIDLGSLPDSSVMALRQAAERRGGKLGTIVLSELPRNQWGNGEQFQRTVVERILRIAVFESPDRENLEQLAAKFEQLAPGGGSIFGDLNHLPKQQHQEVADALKARTVRFLYGTQPNGCRIVGCLLGLGPIKRTGKKTCMTL